MPKHLNKTLILGSLVCVLLIASAAVLVFSPAARTGPFGFGLPAEMKKYHIENLQLSIDYPESWVAFETPGGNHGDEEVVATIVVPGRSFPHVYIASKEFPTEEMEQVIQWGEQRANEYPGFTQLGTGEFTTSKGESGAVSSYTWTSKSIFVEETIRCSDYYLLRSDLGIKITVCAKAEDWSEVEPMFQSMIRSLE